MSTGVKADEREEQGESTQTAAVTYSLRVLAEDVARAEIGDDAFFWGGGGEERNMMSL